MAVIQELSEEQRELVLPVDLRKKLTNSLLESLNPLLATVGSAQLHALHLLGETALIAGLLHLSINIIFYFKVYWLNFFNKKINNNL